MAKSSKGGRPSKLTPKVQRVICDALREGHFKETAARLAGVSYDSVRQWLIAGKAGDPRFLGFLNAVREAEAESEASLVDMVKTHAKKDYKAATWMLERRHSKRWAKPEVPAVNVHVNPENLGLDALKQRFKELTGVEWRDNRGVIEAEPEPKALGAGEEEPE